MASTNSMQMQVDPATFAKIRRLCLQWCGVKLDVGKEYLIVNRLKPVLDELGIADLESLVETAQRPSGTIAKHRIIDALTTHETLFFRDQTPFDAIRHELIPKFQRAHAGGRPTLKVWSAACSTGQEPYSFAMMLLESGIDLNRWNIDIEATDVSASSVANARQGVFADHETARGLTPSQRDRFFEKTEAGWKINAKVRQMVHFRVENLLEASPSGKRYDIIFCRNVAIYFDNATRLKLFETLSRRLTDDGVLFVGCSEVLTNTNHVLRAERIGRATGYQKVGETHERASTHLDTSAGVASTNQTFNAASLTR